MNDQDKITYFIVGALVGFAFGYITRSLRKINKTVEEMDDLLKKGRDERGFMRIPAVADAAFLVILALTLYGVVGSQKASRDVQDAQDAQGRTVACTQQYLSKTIKALNERTTYTTEQASANVELQKSQATFLNIFLRKPPASNTEAEDALNAYFSSLTEFVKVAGQTQQKVTTNPYPTDEEFVTCVMGKKETS